MKVQAIFFQTLNPEPYEIPRAPLSWKPRGRMVRRGLRSGVFAGNRQAEEQAHVAWKGSGFRVWGFGFRVSGLGFRV